jgi:iron complex outermembrane receptor protein
MINPAWLAVITAVMLFLFQINAATAAPTELEPVVVSATRSHTGGAATAGAVTVITRADIETSGAVSLAQVLRNQGGVQLTDLYGDGSRTRVSLRGFGENAVSNTLILVDGRRLNNPDIGAPELAGLALKDIERIEITQGSAGALYGDQAVGGVIHIVTRTPDRLRAGAEATVASYDDRRAAVHVEQALDNGFSFRASAENRSADNYRDHNEARYRHAFARVDYHHASGVLFVDGQEANEDINLPGGLFRPGYNTDRRQPRFPNDDASTLIRAQRLGLRQGLSPTWSLEAEAMSRDSDVDGRLSDTPFRQRRRVEEFTPRFVGTYRLDAGTLLLTLGADVTRSDYRITSMFGVTNAEQETSSEFVRAVVPLTPRLSVTLGTRHARVTNDLRDTFAFPAGVGLDDDARANEFGVSYQAGETWRLFVRRDENFRFAKVDEHTQTLGGVTGLDTQTGTSLEAGAEWGRDGNRFRAVVYRLDLDNEIDYDTAVYANVNLDPTRRDGVTLEGRVRLSGRTALSGQYAWTDASFRRGPYAGNTVPFVARDTLRLALDHNPADGWTLFGELQAIGDRYAAGDIANAFERLDGETVINAGLHYRQSRWRVSARINNLTDRRYADYAASSYNPATFQNETAFYAAPERNLALTFAYRFE